MVKTAAQFAALATLTTDVQGLAAQGNRVLMGYSVRESAGTPAVASLVLRHGTSGAGTLIASVELAANASTTEWFGPNGLAVPNGVFVDRVTGETELTLFWATD